MRRIKTPCGSGAKTQRDAACGLPGAMIASRDRHHVRCKSVQGRDQAPGCYSKRGIRDKRRDSPLVITSTQAIADSGSVWIKAQNKAGELLSIRYDGASDSFKGGSVTINGAGLPIDEKASLLAAIAKANVPYAGELVMKRIQ